MTTEIIVRYFHFISIFTLFASLVTVHLLLSKSMTRSEVRKVAVLDSIYGISAALVLITGLLMWFVVGKPAGFYTQNAVFHSKLLLFVIVALVSVYPTIFFVKNRKGSAEDEITPPKALIMIVRFELLLIAIIPLLATLMSRGVGYFGS